MLVDTASVVIDMTSVAVDTTSVAVDITSVAVDITSVAVGITSVVVGMTSVVLNKAPVLVGPLQQTAACQASSSVIDHHPSLAFLVPRDQAHLLAKIPVTRANRY